MCPECQREYALLRLSRHRKSLKHIKNVEKLKENDLKD